MKTLLKRNNLNVYLLINAQKRKQEYSLEKIILFRLLLLMSVLNRINKCWNGCNAHFMDRILLEKIVLSSYNGNL